jgi:6-phosphofructokinase 1
VKTLIVVSGGDAPGINAAIAQFTALATASGDTVVGAVGGFEGALAGHIAPIKPVLIAPWASRGGSYLQSSRAPVLSELDGQSRFTTLLSNHKIDNLLMLGGDGTQRFVAPLMAAWGIPCIAIPTTIDNDVPGTEMTIGFDSACNFAHQTIDNLLMVAFSLAGRIYTVETLGGNTGFIALNVALAARAQVVLIPEYDYSNEWLTQRLQQIVTRDNYALVVLSEGVAASRTIAPDIREWTGLYCRDTRLGHGQRGAIPTHQDRLLASKMARVAYESLSTGEKAGMTVVQQGNITLATSAAADLPPRVPERHLYNDVNGLPG